MKLDIYDVSKLVELNNLPKISTTHILSRDGTPSVDGLYSYELFGRPGSKDRKFQFGHIDLGKNFFHPVIFKSLVEMDRAVNDIISGTKFVQMNPDGSYSEATDEDKAETGIDFFYNNWEKIKFDDRGSQSRKDKIDLFSHLSKEEIFCSKWPVCPPFYRDIDLSSSASGVVSKDELTSLYASLIALTNVVRDHAAYFTGHITQSKIQNKLFEIHSFFTKKLAKKSGLIRQALMGKSVDYAVRAVISGPEVNAESYDQQQIPYKHIGIPLPMCMSAFLPFVLVQLENFFSSFVRGSTVNFISTDKSIELSDLATEEVSKEKILKLIKLYSISHEDRLAPLVITGADGKKHAVSMYEEELGRPFTLTDLFFMATWEATKDKHVIATRYPVEDFRNVAIQKVKILTTERTKNMELLGGDILFDNYPLIKEGVKPKWVDSVRPNNSYLSAWGGDFDGQNSVLFPVWIKLFKNFLK